MKCLVENLFTCGTIFEGNPPDGALNLKRAVSQAPLKILHTGPLSHRCLFFCLRPSTGLSRVGSPILPGLMALPLQWSSSTHDNQPCWCPHKQKGRASVGLFCKPSAFLSGGEACQCAVRVCLSVCRLVRRDKAAGCTRAWHCQEASESLRRVTSKPRLRRLCVRASERALVWHFFFSCRRPLRLRGGLDAACRLSTAVFFFFLVLLFLLSPKLFIPATLALTRCLSGWNSSGLKAQSWQQATTHQLGSAVTERRKQKMRYKVTRGRGKGGWGSATALEPHSLSPPEPPLKVVKKRNPRLLRIFPLTAMTGGYTSHRWLCVIARLHPVHICLFEEWGEQFKSEAFASPELLFIAPL